MDVTRSNFKTVLPDVEKAIANADFLCIDGEFTGLRIGQEVNSFATPAEYYHCLFTDSMKFLLVQFGLCAFRWDKTSKTFKQCSFNFYLFPRPTSRSANEKIFWCQSSSMDFLAKQKFDFNKLFYEGISYVTTAEEVKMREHLEEKQAEINSKIVTNTDTDPKAQVNIKDEDKPQIEEICEKVKKFLEDSSADSIEFDKLNSYVRKLLFQELESRFKNSVHLSSQVLGEKSRVLVVSRVTSQEDMIKKNEEAHAKEWEELEDAVGFSTVARKISESGKLVIGHSMLLDMIHVLSHFFSPLPEDYKDFKEFASCIFPRLIDTMYMASLPPFKENINGMNLSALSKTVSAVPFHMPPIESENENNLIGYGNEDTKYHEAGYDAYMTGRCFLSMCEFLARRQNKSLEELDFSSNEQILKPFLNKLFLYKTSFQDSPYINLQGNDANPSRDHVFHIEFPKEWKKNDLIHLFYHYGGVNIAFINDTSAYLGLWRRDQTQQVIRVLVNENPKYKLTPYKKYKAIMSRKNDTVDYTPAKERFEQTHWVAKKHSSSNEGNHLTSAESIAKKRKTSDDIHVKNASDTLLPELVPRDSALGLAATTRDVPKRISKQKDDVEDTEALKKLRTSSRNLGHPIQSKGKHQSPPVLAAGPKSKNVSSQKKLRSTARVFPESDDWE